MEKVKTKVKEVVGAGDWESQHGTLYSYIYTMEDGTTIKANHKVTPAPFKPGDEVEYLVKRDDPTHGKSGNVSKPDTGNFPQQQSGKSYGKGNNASFAISYAKDIQVAMIAAGKGEDSVGLIARADVILEWLNANS